MRRFLVKDDSMAPALLPGDVVYCRRPGPPFERGDYVVFTHPHQAGMRMIKRVIGLPGETILIDTGTILVNGREAQDRWGVGLISTDGEWTLAPDQIFVLSDNRSATRDDSRSFGPINGHTSRRVWWAVRVGGDRGWRPGLP